MFRTNTELELGFGIVVVIVKKRVKIHSHAALPALRADSGTGDTPNQGCFRGTNVITVQTRNRKALKNMVFNDLASVGILFHSLPLKPQKREKRE